MSTPRVLAFAGSLRKDSYNKKLVRIAAEGARAGGAAVTLIDLADLPMPVFDEDLEARDGLHPNARRFKDYLMGCDGFIISSPEYNSSFSAALKNAIDWASRPAMHPEGRPERPLECFSGKVCGLVSTSTGALGGLRGLVHLRAVLGNIGVMVIPEQVAVMKAAEAMDEAGRLKDPKQEAAVKAVGEKVAKIAARLLG